MTTSTHTDDYRTLMLVVREARKATGLTQQEVADRLKKPQSYIAKVEGGEQRIDIVEFIGIARAMRIDPATLFRSVLRKIGAK